MSCRIRPGIHVTRQEGSQPPRAIGSLHHGRHHSAFTYFTVVLATLLQRPLYDLRRTYLYPGFLFYLCSMANWDYVLKFIICGDAAVGKSSLLVRLTDQRFLANPDPTVRSRF